MQTEHQAVPAPGELLAGIKVIDADTHLSEPHDLWTRRAPAALRARVPQVKVIDGKRAWVIDGDKSIGTGASPISAIRKDGHKPPGLWFKQASIEECHPGSYDMDARLKVMDETGIWAQIIYPNTLGFGGQKAAKVEPGLRLAATQIYNDAMAELQADSGGRMFPMALLPWWDVNLSVREAERARGMGLHGININPDPQGRSDPAGRPLPDLGDPYWNPLWEMCQEHNLPINFHIGASEQVMDWIGSQYWPSLSEERRLVISSTMLFANNGRVMANIMMSGLLDRYPKLQFVSVESGLGWVPFLLDALEYQYRENNTTAALELTPFEYFQRNFYACFWFEHRHLGRLIQATGVDNVMFETDFPHPTCLYPDALERSAPALAALTHEERRKIMSANAARVYSIPVG
jgi:predicted TIM-barrel fold metal-dependent hydrolase